MAKKRRGENKMIERKEKEGLLLELLKAKNPDEIDNEDVEKIINMTYPELLCASKQEFEKIAEIAKERYFIQSPVFMVFIWTDEDAGGGIMEGSFRGYFSGTKDQIINFLKHHIEEMIELKGEKTAIPMFEVPLSEAAEGWYRTIQDLVTLEDKYLIKFFLKTGPVIKVYETGAICPLCEKNPSHPKLKIPISRYWRKNKY